MIACYAGFILLRLASPEPPLCFGRASVDPASLSGAILACLLRGMTQTRNTTPTPTATPTATMTRAMTKGFAVSRAEFRWLGCLVGLDVGAVVIEGADVGWGVGGIG